MPSPPNAISTVLAVRNDASFSNGDVLVKWEKHWRCQPGSFDMNDHNLRESGAAESHQSFLTQAAQGQPHEYQDIPEPLLHDMHLICATSSVGLIEMDILRCQFAQLL